MASEEFYNSFISGGTTCQETCDCGKTYFVCREYSGDYEEGEYEKLSENKLKNPKRYIELDYSISYGYVDGRLIVRDCDCKLAEKYESFIWNHKEIIREYINSMSLKLLKEAEYNFKSNYIKTDEEAKKEYWFDLDSAPKNTSWFLGMTEDGKIEKVHYACDLSGEEQPPFEGFFKEVGSYFSEVKIINWRPLND